MRLGFTGTRHGMTMRQMSAFRSWASLREITEFHDGMCVGADEQAHEIVSQVSEAKMIRHPPTDQSIAVSPKEGDPVLPAKPYLRRNRAIVAATEHLAASPDGPERQRSGTWSTVRFARKLGRPVAIFWPDGSATFEVGRRD